jgi:superfamily II DNA or RNA helicase
MEKLENCKYRFGFTGTLDGSLTNKITLEGLFGPVKQVTTTTELQEQGHVAELDIKVIVLKHDKDTAKLASKMNYQDEVDLIVRSDKRNKFIRNLGLSLEGNSLILFQYVDKHGTLLYDMIKQKEPDRTVFFVHGGVDGEDREEVRSIVEKESNAIILASPSKTRVRVLQSIGRGLRKSDSKDKMVLYDIADDLRHGSKVNFTLNHLNERLNIYNDQQFNYKIFNTDL